MSVVPLLLVVLSLLIVDYWEINLATPVTFVYSAAVFVVLYVPLFWFVSMNAYERDLFTSPLRKIRK